MPTFCHRKLSLELALICDKIITLKSPNNKSPIDSIFELFVSQIKTLLDKHALLRPPTRKEQRNPGT